MRASDPPVRYLVGTPKGRLTKLEKTFAEPPWEKVRDQVDVKLLRSNLDPGTHSAGELMMSRYTQPDCDQKLLLEHLKLELPPQPPPKIAATPDLTL